ncbi:MAG: methyltransferase [Nanoarchaeota archaeon]|nr:methyltransferase [Nanoarchaeota archaeon]
MVEKSVYEPREDTFLMATQVKKLAKGKVLEIGAGSGYLSDIAAQKKAVKSVTACDINPHSIAYMQKQERKGKLAFRKKIKIIKSDLFSTIKGKYATIIFNPPYLPEDDREGGGWLKKATTGGKKGWETIQNFLNNLAEFLETNGKTLLLFSSLTNKAKVEELIANRLFDYKKLSQKKLPFEMLYVYEITKSKVLKDLEKKKITQIRKFAHGHRGIVYQALMGKKKVAIKVQKDKKGPDRIRNEVNWLKELNKKNIGPKFIFTDKTYFVMEFVEGQKIWDYIAANDKTSIKKIIKNAFSQCAKMDQIGVTKEEMHHPIKHLLIVDDRAKLIDFERCRRTKDPKNVTQFAQFITSTSFLVALMGKGFTINQDKIRRLAKIYKSNMCDRNLDKIIKEVK